ncbi:MAG: OmpA family protein [Pseudomonadota bacterium]
MINQKLAFSLAFALALPACGATDRGFSYLGPEAGAEVHRADLGLANAQNAAVQTGQLSQMAANLTRKFAAEAPARINFAFNSSSLDAAARTALRSQAAWIKQHPQIVFRVYGHTDKVGSAAYNRRLGKRRANAAVNYLVSLGVPRSKLQAVASFGETRPIVLTEGPSRENRRTVTEVSGFAKGRHAPDLDGKYAVTVYNEYITTTYKVQTSDGE